MGKKVSKTAGKTAVIQVIILVALLLSYTLLILFMPPISKAIQKLYAFILLTATAISDIRTKEIPLAVCAGVIYLALIYSFIYSWDLAALITAVVITALLLAVRFAGGKIIGAGDALMLGSSVMMLSIDEILGFLFLTFLFSSVYGVVLAIKRRRFQDAVVPLAPCIAAAFVMRCLFFSGSFVTLLPF